MIVIKISKTKKKKKRITYIIKFKAENVLTTTEAEKKNLKFSLCVFGPSFFVCNCGIIVCYVK